jgi:hypothetical protein
MAQKIIKLTNKNTGKTLTIQKKLRPVPSRGGQKGGGRLA